MSRYFYIQWACRSRCSDRKLDLQQHKHFETVMEVRSSALCSTLHTRCSLSMATTTRCLRLRFLTRVTRVTPKSPSGQDPAIFHPVPLQLPLPRARGTAGQPDPTNTSSAPTLALPGVSAGTNVCLWASVSTTLPEAIATSCV